MNFNQFEKEENLFKPITWSTTSIIVPEKFHLTTKRCSIDTGYINKLSEALLQIKFMSQNIDDLKEKNYFEKFNRIVNSSINYDILLYVDQMQNNICAFAIFSETENNFIQNSYILDYVSNKSDLKKQIENDLNSIYLRFTEFN